MHQESDQHTEDRSMDREARLRTVTRGTSVKLIFSGALDLYSAGSMKEEVEDTISGDVTSLTVDLSRVCEMDSSGIGLVFLCKARMTERRGNFTIHGASPRIARLLNIVSPGVYRDRATPA